MIDTKEIRAGNWVIKGDGTNAISETLYEYKSVGEDESCFTFANHYFPIPLSADVLGRSSFRHAFGNWYKNLEAQGIDEGLPFLRYSQKTKQWYLFERLLPFQPAFLHQLQNLYFALTNKELPITFTQLR
jgi:hypothetical protein